MLAIRVLSRGLTQRWLLVLGLLSVGILCGLGLVTFPLIYSSAILISLCFAAGLLHDPIIGLAAALFLGPLWAWLMLQSSGIPAQIGQYALMLFLFFTLVNRVLRRKAEITFPPLFLPVMIFLFFGLLSLWNPVDVWQGFTEFAKWAQIAIVFILVYDRMIQKNIESEPVFMLALLGGSGLLQACIGLWQFAFKNDGPETFAISSRFYRAYGTFQQPNPYAGFVAMMAAILVGILFVLITEYVKKRSWKRTEPNNHMVRWIVLLGVGAAILTAGLIASWSRGGWAGFAAAVLVMLYLTPVTRRRGFLLIVILLLLGWSLYSMGLLPQNITDRLSGFMALFQFSDIRSVGITDANFSVIERIAHWQSALDMWRTRFWIGVGLGGYESAYPMFLMPNWVLPLGHAHNIYLNMLAETGILGLSAYLLMIGTLLFKLVHASRCLNGWQRGLAIGLTGAWAHLTVHNLVDNLLVNNVHIHIGLMLALSAWVITQASRGKPGDVATQKYLTWG